MYTSPVNTMSSCTIELLVCSQCSDQVSELMIMPCEHTFCRACLRDIEIGRRQRDPCARFSCPSCDAECPIPEAGMDTIMKTTNPKDVPEQQEGHDSKVLCCGANCNKRAVHYCCTGCKYLCEQCHALHKSMSFSKTHMTTLVSQMKTNKPKGFLKKSTSNAL